MKIFQIILLALALSSLTFSCIITPRKYYQATGDLEEDTRAYLVTSTPSLFLDTFHFDDDQALFLGKGSFKRRFKAYANLSATNYAIVLEKRGYTPQVTRVSELMQGRSLIQVNQPAKFFKAEKVELPMGIVVSDFSFEIGKTSRFESSNYLDGAYHRSYTFGEDNSIEGNENQMESDALKYVTDLIVKLKSKKNDSIPIPPISLTADVYLDPGSYSYYYSRNPSIKMDLSLIDYNGNEIKSTDKDIVIDGGASFFDLLMEEIFDLLKDADLEKVASDYRKEVKMNLFNWKQHRISIPSKQPEHISNAIVTIKTAAGHGSGVIISEDGFVLTNNHVIAGATEIKLVTASGQEINTELVRTNPIYDIALLKAKKENFNKGPLFEDVMSISEQPFEVGTEVMCIGSPLDTKLYGSVSQGIITGKTDQFGTKHYVVSATVNPGNSGGALVNSQGKLIGIVNAKLVGNNVKNIGFAIPINDIKEQLKLQFNADQD